MQWRHQRKFWYFSWSQGYPWYQVMKWILNDLQSIFYWRKIINVPDQFRLYFGLLAFRNFDSLLVRYCPFLLDYTVSKLFYGKSNYLNWKIQLNFTSINLMKMCITTNTSFYDARLVKSIAYIIFKKYKFATELLWAYLFQAKKDRPNLGYSVHN